MLLKLRSSKYVFSYYQRHLSNLTYIPVKILTYVQAVSQKAELCQHHTLTASLFQKVITEIM